MPADRRAAAAADDPREATATARSLRGRLSRPLVLTEALVLADREGLAALTMRRLATRLGVEPMALYRYAAGKQALLDGLVEAFFAEVAARLELPADTGAARAAGTSGLDWRDELHRYALAFTRVAEAHPEVFPLVATRPLAVPLARRPTPMLQLNECVLDLLSRAGFDDRAALALQRAVTAWVLGYLLVDKRLAVDNPEEPDPMLRLGLHRLPAADYPRLRATAPLLTDHDERAELAAGLDALLHAFPSPTPTPDASR
ncbi:TetR family transcriptional regulator [Peterkaempfera sp. SMS 1(5)a]|uniref:TetR family transcriptional regulator n=1 Tax=Peterkaempfera podocarpi TaxID=3232308 RepID=UPI00366F7CC7